MEFTTSLFGVLNEDELKWKMSQSIATLTCQTLTCRKK